MASDDVTKKLQIVNREVNTEKEHPNNASFVFGNRTNHGVLFFSIPTMQKGMTWSSMVTEPLSFPLRATLNPTETPPPEPPDMVDVPTPPLNPSLSVTTTKDFSDGVEAAADFGGSVLTGNNGNPLGVLARQLGLRLHKVRDVCPLYLPDGKCVDSEIDYRIEVSFNKLLERVCKLGHAMIEESKSVDVPLGTALEAFRRVYKVAEDKEERMLLSWHLAILEYANATFMSNLSMAYWDQDDSFEMGGDHCFIPGGNEKFVRALAEDLLIFYGRTDWKAITTVCTNNGPDGVLFELFKVMPRIGIKHDNYAFNSMLNLCSWELLNYGRHVHFLVNSLITVSFICSCDYTAENNLTMTMNPCSGNVGEAQNVFKKIEERNFASWNIMLSLFVQKNITEGIGFIYLKMTIVEIELDDFTFGNLLVALSALQTVGMLHSYLCKNGFTNVGVLKALAVSYCKHGKIYYAFQILYGFPYKGLISWVRIIFVVVLKMHNRPNVYSLNLVLSICYITLAMSHVTQELVRINDGKKREAPNFYGPTDRNLSCGVSITSGIQDAYSRASITGFTLDKESGGGSVKKSDAFIKKSCWRG